MIRVNRLFPLALRSVVFTPRVLLPVARAGFFRLNTSSVGSDSGDDGKGETAEELLQKTQDELKDTKDKYLRALAEAENVRQRARRDVEFAQNYGICNFARSLLEVADNIQRAIESVPTSEGTTDPSDSLATLLEGVNLTQKELYRVFEQQGVKQFESLGKPFDPSLHLALFQTESVEYDNGIISHVVKDGYTMKDRILRPAQVGVVKKKNVENGEKQE